MGEFIDTFVVERVAIVVAGLILICLIVRFLYYHAKLGATYQCRDQYLQVLERLSQDQQDLQHYDKLAEVEARFTRLFKQANSSPTGFIIRNEPETFGAFGPSPSMVRTYLQSFHASIGYFLARRNETISPIYWLEAFFNWPKTLLGMLGFNRQGSFANLLQLLVTMLEAVGVILLVVSRAQQL